MICEKHNIEMQVICDVDSCGKCYEELMEVEKLTAPRIPPTELVYVPSKHMIMNVRVKGARSETSS